MSCFICEKHAGHTSQPPGGYMFEDEFWLVCHFPAAQANKKGHAMKVKHQM